MANATTETKLEPLDFIAPRDLTLTWNGGTLHPPIRTGQRVECGRDARQMWVLRVDGRELIAAQHSAGLREQLLSLRVFCEQKCEACGSCDNVQNVTLQRYGVESARLCGSCAGRSCGETAFAVFAAREKAKEPTPESFPDRVLRIAREAGYEPTGVERVGNNGWMVLFERPTLGVFARGVRIGDGKDDKHTLDLLYAYAGPDNQPEAVRARRADAIRFKPSAGDRPRDADIVGARDTRTAPVVGALQPGDTVTHAAEYHSGVPGPVLRAITEIVRSVDAQGMALSRLRDQLASGGVDCAETRARNVARVKAEARVVGEMQDAVRAVNGWVVKRKRCDVCKGATEELYLGTCVYCARKRGMGCREFGPGIAVDRTPGPHEGACAWASATWEDL